MVPAAGDLLGRRRVFIAGLCVFSLASLCIGLAGTPAELVAARAVQSIGAAILSPATLAAADEKLGAYRKKVGDVAFFRAVSGGQYSHPDGLFFGGGFALLGKQSLAIVGTIEMLPPPLVRAFCAMVTG